MKFPSFDRWRAALIARSSPGCIGSTDTLTFTNVAASVAFACPFFDAAGASCEAMITYYFSSARRPSDADPEDGDVGCAIGACDAHLRAALDTINCSMAWAFVPFPDVDAIDIEDARPAMASSPSDAENALASTLLERSMCELVDFGTTEWDIRYPFIRAARIAVIGDTAKAILPLVCGLELTHRPYTDGTGIVLESSWDREGGAAAVIATNRALRAVLDDLLDRTTCQSEDRYAAIAAAPVSAIPFEPRSYDLLDAVFCPDGDHKVIVEYWPTPTELQWRHGNSNPRTVMLRVAAIPRPGDYLETGVARYRFIETHPIDGSPNALWASTTLHSLIVSPEEELRLLEESVRCTDCGIDVIDADHQFMAEDELWRTAGYSAGDMACIFCLEKRIGRELRPNDFKDVPLNQFSVEPEVRRRIDGHVIAKT